MGLFEEKERGAGLADARVPALPGVWARQARRERVRLGLVWQGAARDGRRGQDWVGAVRRGRGVAGQAGCGQLRLAWRGEAG